MRKKIVMLLIMLMSIYASYAYTNITSCADDPTIAGEEYRLNQNISISGADCLTIQNDSITIDCQGHSIISDNSALNNGIITNSGINNVTIRNCIIKKFGYSSQGTGIYMFNSNNFNITNVSLDNNNDGIYISNSQGYVNTVSLYNSILYGIYLFNANNNVLQNINIESSSRGIYFKGANYNIFKNILVKNNVIGTYLDYSNYNTFTNITLIENTRGVYITGSDFFDATNNMFTNSQIYNNTNDNIYFDDSFSYNNTFQDSYLGNFSKINSFNWSQTPNYFYDNNYLSGTKINNGCFDYPINNTCEQVSPSGSSPNSSSNAFPFGNLITSLLIIIGGLIIN